MSDIAISVSGLGKRYRIGAQQQMYRTLREKLNDKAMAPIRAARHMLTRNGNGNGNGRSSELIWALKDVSFDVRRGEVVGIIGRNGAGKSTLLKILSRITEPTEGYADITGRLASLLEVGTGFHPELTGRVNILLNGSILGMRRTEILRKFDEIVAFAEIEKFIDTPVKHYSSGMYVRLAFAVAAHLEPEILLVDEVLAVGDAGFQKKCLGKMGEVAQEGRTVLFVSHNMAAVQRLCSNSLWLADGRIHAYGSTRAIVKDYLSTHNRNLKADQWLDLTRSSRIGSGEVRFKSISYSVPGSEAATPVTYEPLEFCLELESDVTRAIGSISVTLSDHHGNRLVNADTLIHGSSVKFEEGSNLIRVKLDKLFLNPGNYVVGLWVADPISGPFDYVDAAAQIDVTKPAHQGAGQTPDNEGLVPCSFTVVVDKTTRGQDAS